MRIIPYGAAFFVIESKVKSKASTLHYNTRGIKTGSTVDWRLYNQSIYL